MDPSGHDLVAFATQAMTASLSPLTASSQRHEYQKFLEGLLASQECSSVLQAILSSDAEDKVGLKILALSMLHDWIKRWWNKISPADHLGMRNFCADILRQPAVHTQPSNFRSKLAAILAEIGERQFPQDWENMMSELTAVWIAGHLHIQEIILKTITFIYIDCTDQEFSNQLPTVRRQEILTGLKAVEEQLLQLLFQFMASHMSATDEAAVYSLTLGLQLLSAIAGIAAHEKFLSSGSNYLQLLGAALRIPGVQLEAMSCLSVLITRKISSPETARAYLLHLSEYVDWKPDALPEALSDRLVFGKAFVTAMGSFLAYNISKFDNSMAMDKVFQRIVQVLHWPGKRAAGLTMGDWTKIYKDEGFKYEHAGILAEALLEVYYTKAAKPLFLVTNTSPEEWFEEEFDDKEDWVDFYASIGGALHHFVQAIAKAHPACVTSFLATKLAEISHRTAVLASTHPSGGAEVSEVVLAGMVLTKYYIGYVDMLVDKKPDDNTDLLRLLDMLSAWQPPLQFTGMIEEKMKMMSLHAHLLPILPQDKVIGILSHLFTYLQSADVPESLQMEAGKCFSAFMRKAAESIAHSPLLTEILQQTAQVLEKVTNTEVQCSLQQSLLALLPHLPNHVQQHVCSICLQGGIQGMQSTFSALCGDNLSTQGYLNAIQSLPEASAMLSKLRHQMRRYVSVITKVPPLPVTAASLDAFLSASPVYSYWVALVGVCLQILGILEDPALHTAAYAQSYLQGIDSLDIKRFTTITLSSLLLTYNSEMRELLLQIYRTLASGCRYRLIHCIDHFHGYMQRLPIACKALPNTHMVLLLKQFLPLYLIHSVPGQQIADTLRELCAHMIQRIYVPLQPLADIGLPADQSVLITEGVRGEMCKLFADLLGTAYGVCGALAPASSNNPSAEEVEREADKAAKRLFLRGVLHSPQVLPGVLGSVQVLLACAGMPGCAGCIPPTLQITTCMLMEEEVPVEVLRFLGGAVFKASLHTLLRQEAWAAGAVEWSYLDLMLLIYAVLVLGLDKHTLTQAPEPKAVKMTAWTGPKKMPQVVPTEIQQMPREILLSTNLVSATEVSALEASLANPQVTPQGSGAPTHTPNRRKAQRGIMKDLVSSMMQRLGGGGGSLLLPSKPKIADLPQRLLPNKGEKERKVAGSGLDAVEGVGSMFEDDPDL